MVQKSWEFCRTAETRFYRNSVHSEFTADFNLYKVYTFLFLAWTDLNARGRSITYVYLLLQCSSSDFCFPSGMFEFRNLQYAGWLTFWTKRDTDEVRHALGSTNSEDHLYPWQRFWLLKAETLKSDPCIYNMNYLAVLIQPHDIKFSHTIAP